MPPKNKKSTSATIPFDEKLILFKFFLAKLGKQAFPDISHTLNDDDYLGYDENNNSRFYHIIKAWCDKKSSVSQAKLMEYDENIYRHLQKISNKRGNLNLKYFQYIGLLFTEIYLDSYFNDKEALLAELNLFIKEHSLKFPALQINDYSEENLHKLCFMCATGSGKTLLMHINILQYQHYFEIAKRNNPRLELDNILLITPNESLSRQHFEELELSSIPAKIFSKGIGGQNSKSITIIDIHKLEEQGKDKTVSVDSFEGNNLVLVDEGHKGLSGDVWYDYRTRLAANGFSFEYSATFKQALKGTSKEALALTDEYGKAIIMDYSYKYFYKDGYGKDYRIYNLKEGINEEQTNLYLTGCLLSFYQQLKVYADNVHEFAPFYVEKPLLVFVGNRVTKSTSKGELTDVEQVLHIINEFTSAPHKAIARIKTILSEQTGLVNSYGRELFSQNLKYLSDLFANDAETIYKNMLQELFNSSQSGRLFVVEFKQVTGEIGLKIGQDGEYFGLISIGDTAKMRKLCEDKGLVTETSEFESSSFFTKINAKNSPITTLIGSRKFTEGWNSWRVATMGLINFAKGEGSQAIQLFGRGVRLRGYDGCLKRSRALQDELTIPSNLSYLEKLTIFGIKADYMTAFKEHLEAEDMSDNANIYEITLPTINRYKEVNNKNLRVLRLKDGINFKKQGERLVLNTPDDEFADYIYKNKVNVDAYAKVQSLVSVLDSAEKEPQKEEHELSTHNLLDCVDWQRVFVELQRYKNEKNFYNICIDKSKIKSILEFKKGNWYTLLIPKEDLEINSVEKLHHLTDVVIMLLKNYLEKYFKFNKAKWESPYLQYANLAEDDNNFVDEYVLEVDLGDERNEELEKLVDELSTLLNAEKSLPEYEDKKIAKDFNVSIFDFRNHLYAPLICVQSQFISKSLKIEVSPVSLTKSEKDFVDGLKGFCENNASFFEDKELYLLRNKSKVGMGFFEAGNFYPDFVMWIIIGNKQYVSFIDPKGLLQSDYLFDNPKILFSKRIKELEERLASGNNQNIVLNSFILSITEQESLKKRFGIKTEEQLKELEDYNVLFLEDGLACVKKMIERITS